MSDPDREQELATAFSLVRPRLVQVAYAILGTIGEAEDVVAEVWPRLARADAVDPVRDVEAWGVVAVGRAALDAYRSARRRREVYVGPWLPEPMVSVADVPVDPADRVTLDDTVGFALLVVLEALSPAERTAWVLHDLFGMTFEEVATVVGRTPVAVRQLASRARAHLASRAVRFSVDPSEHRHAVERFLAAAAGGELNPLIAVLDPDVVLTSDGGGVVSAARRPVVGADRVARFLLGIAGRVASDARVSMVEVNGYPGVGIVTGDRLTDVISLSVVDGRVTRVDIVRAPAKLVAGTARLLG